MHNSTQARRRARNESGFSLIELIVVITIIGILATAVVVNIGGVDDDGKAARVKADFQAMNTAASFYKNKMGSWPQSVEELINPPEGDRKFLDVSEAPVDPWTNQPYIVEFEPNGRPIFVSYGADQSEGGDGVNEDIRSNEMGGKGR